MDFEDPSGAACIPGVIVPARSQRECRRSSYRVARWAPAAAVPDAAGEMGCKPVLCEELLLAGSGGTGVCRAGRNNPGGGCDNDKDGAHERLPMSPSLVQRAAVDVSVRYQAIPVACLSALGRGAVRHESNKRRRIQGVQGSSGG